MSIPKRRNHVTEEFKIETGEYHLSEAAKKRVNESLKKVLMEELAKEHPTLGGSDAHAAVGIGGHANVSSSRLRA
jgi:hypothetical protein